MKKGDVNVKLNVHEVGILLSALQLLENIDENRIAREYGSATALYERLYTVWQTLDKSETGIRNDVIPSY